MEYIEGHDLRKCDRESLTAVLDALIYLQNMYWERRECQAVDLTFEASLPRQQNRGKYLNDADLEHAYAKYLRLYSSVLGRYAMTIFCRLMYCVQTVMQL